MIKKVAVTSLLIAFVFGGLALGLYHFQKKTESECIVYLKHCGITGAQLDRYDNLLKKNVSAELNDSLEARFIPEKDMLLKKHKNYAYWTAVCRGVAEFAIVILLILGLRKLFSRIYIPVWIYRKLWSD